MSEYKSAIGIDATSIESHFNLGNLYNKLNLYDDSIKEYTKIINIDANYADAYKSLGYVYYEKLKDNAQAKTYFSQYLKLKPQSSDAKIINDILTSIQ